jgi:hypothetical protein
VRGYSGRRGRTFIAWFKARQPTVSRSPRAPCGSRTHLAGLVDQRLCRSAKGTRSGRRGNRGLRRTRQAHRSAVSPAVFGTAAIASWLALPFSSCGGRNRTCNRLLNREPPYHSATPQEVRTVGVEPTLSGSRNRRITSLSYVLNGPHYLPKQRGQASPLATPGLKKAPAWRNLASQAQWIHG